jgi:hypothetical protein
MAPSDFDDDAKNSFAGGVAAASNGTIAAEDVNVTNVTSIVNSTTSTRRALSLTSGIKVSYTISVIIESLGLDIETAMPRLREVLSWGVGSSQMQRSFNALMLEARSSRGLNFTDVSFADLVVHDEDAILTVLETARPSAAPTSIAKDESWDVVMMVALPVAGVVVLVSVAIGSFYWRRGRNSRKLSPVHLPAP